LPIRKLFVFSLLLLVNACCPLTSVHPLGDPQKSDYDSRLAGVWRQDIEKDYVMLHIGRAHNGRMQVIAVEHDEGGKVDYDGFAVSGQRLNHHYYIDIDTAELTPRHREGQQGHVIVSYHLPDENTLVIGALELNAVAGAIRAEKLAGEITYQRTAPPSSAPAPAPQSPKIECAYITDTSVNLAKFIAGSDPGQLFKPILTFKRVSP
jgi:hypothetical protein